MSRLQRLRSAGWVLGLTLASLLAASSSVTAQPLLVNPAVQQRVNLNQPFRNQPFRGAVGVGMLPAVVEVNWAAWTNWNQLAFYRTWWANQQALVNPLAWGNIPDPLGPVCPPGAISPLSPLAPNMINPFVPKPFGVSPQPAPLTGKAYLFGGTGPIGAFPPVNNLALGLGVGPNGSPAAPGLPGLGVGIAGPLGMGGVGGVGIGLNGNLGGLGGVGNGLNGN